MYVWRTYVHFSLYLAFVPVSCTLFIVERLDSSGHFGTPEVWYIFNFGTEVENIPNAPKN